MSASNNITQDSAKSVGKIFEAPPIWDTSLDDNKSLGHFIQEALLDHYKDYVIYVDHASDRHWTGAQFWSKIKAVATCLLAEFNLKYGDIVCINYDHTDYTVILAFAVVAAGGHVICTYPKDPYAELLYAARKTEPKLLFCHAANLEWASKLSHDLGYHVTGVPMDSSDSAQGVCSLMRMMDYDFEKSPLASLVPVECVDLDEQLAFIIMSSGTTGKPKAIPKSHRAMLHEVGLLAPHKYKHMVFGNTASLDYVSGQLVLLGALRSGYRTIIMNGFEDKVFAEAIARHKINVVYLGAASFYKLITYKHLYEYDLSSISVVFPMGAKITYLDEIETFVKKNPNLKAFRQAYGTSETSGIASKSVPPEVYLQDADNCGPMWEGCKAKILDVETGKLLGYNQQGALHVKSRTLFKGYYDMERVRNAAKTCCAGQDGAIQASPYYADENIFDEDGYYITGDIAYFNEKDEIYIVGRYKELMSCRGAKKVVPQELEEIIIEHPAVAQVCVLGVPNAKEPTLHCPRAFIVPEEAYYTSDTIELTGRGITSSASDTSGDSGVTGEVSNSDKQAREDEEEQELLFQGNHTMTRMAIDRRREICKDIMAFVNQRVGWEKQLTGGIVIIDNMPNTRASGKMHKQHLRSLTLEQVEIYGDRSS